MRKIDLSQTISTLANIGVIAGIIFLAIQVQQNTRQLRNQSYQTWNASNTEINMAIADPELSALVSSGHDGSENLTKETYIAYAMFHLSMVQMAQATHYLYLQGALDEELWQTEMRRIAGVLSLTGVRQWWEAGGRTQLSPSFVSFIESVEPDEVVRWNWNPDRGYFPSDFSTPFGASDE